MMYQPTPNGIKLKIFVKESNGEFTSEKPNTNKKYLPVAGLTGSKAKEFYEDVLKNSSLPCEQSSVEPKRRSKVIVKPVTVKRFKNTDLLKMAQNNEVNNLKIFFTQNKDHNVDIMDEFGWTPLMCASCSGAEEAVEILLENGANLHKRDRLGNTALTLARQKNHERIVQKLEYCKKKSGATIEEVKPKESDEHFFCPTCQENFTINKNKHESSTVHLFNSRPVTSTFYGIPESNKGFQLLLREGWNKGKGLGPDGTGRKFPVKAVIKKDRTGIGAPTPPTDRSKIRHSEMQGNKKRNIYNKWREKDFEKNFRLEFS